MPYYTYVGSGRGTKEVGKMKTREEMELKARALSERAWRTRDYPGTSIPLAKEADEIRARIALLYPPTAEEAATKTAEGFAKASNFMKVAAGTRALDRLAAGVDPDTVIEEMRAEWRDAAHKMVD